MKKFLLSLALMLPCLGAWAQTPVLTYENITTPQELSAEDAQTIRDLSTNMTIVADVDITNSSNVSVLFAAVADYTSSSTENNSVWALGAGGNALRYIVGPREGGWYSSTNGTLTTSTKKIICTYNGTAINFYADGSFIKTQNSTKALNTFTGENAKFYLGGLLYNTNTTWGNFNGTINSVKVYDSVLTTEQIAAMCYPANAVTDYTKFVHGNVYTFQTKRGWLMAKEGTDFVYSSGKLNDVTPAEDNANCQWVYYATEKGKYLYNVAVSKFISYNSADLNSIPLTEEVTTSNIEFKNSTLGGYPILIGLESKVVNHNISNNAFTYGALLWGDGWTGYHSDEGSATLALSQGAATAETLAAIKEKVDVFEADNTLAVAELDAAITTAQAWFTQYVGTGVGKYTATDNDFMSKFEAIVAFRQAIQATNTPTPAEVEAKTTELGALISSFRLNMPESGKFYTFKNDDYYITSVKTNDGKIAMNTTKDASAIYYYDGTHLLAYTTGLYVGLNATDWAFEEIGSNDVSAIEFVAAANGTIGKYNIKSGGRWLHRTNAFVNRCSSNTCGDAHNFTLEEVTALPVTITEAGYATFYAPVAVQVEGVTANTVTVNGEWATLNAIGGGVIPANTGVILSGNDGDPATADTYNFTITTTAEQVSGNALTGTVATTYVTGGGYILGKQVGEVALYSAILNKTDKTDNPAFQNNGFKAYLPASAVSAGVNALRFNFGGNTTAIETVVNGIDVNAPIFDLSGRRVNAATKGIYIQNGKKFIVK